jgi:cell division protein FtsI (penicillin-binding protein 3)
MLGRTDSRRRLIALLLIFVVGSLALVARLAFWQVGQRDFLVDQASAQTSIRTEDPTRRGEIYDRTGTVVLATSVARDRLVAAPKDLDKTARRQTADELIRILELDETQAATLRERMALDKPYVILARGIEPSMADRIRTASRSGELLGITLESEPLRVYPQRGGGPDSTLAAQLLGFVNREGDGQYGVEQQYQEILAGSPRVTVSDRDASGQAVPGTAEVQWAGAAGEDLSLTIDAGLQLAVEQELLAAWIADKAKSVSAVVMDPYTGEIYAQATYPSYDANEYGSIAATDPDRFIDPIVSSVYEPGSVFKMMTATAALERKTVALKTKINDVGTLKLDGGRARIDDADRKAKGWMTFEDGIAFSRNVVAAKVAMGLADTTDESSAILHDMWLRLGYGQPTGIDLAGEVSGLVNDPGIQPWQEIDLANASFGQGVAVTPIQLATSYATLMNGGTQVRPHVVKAIGDREIITAPGPRVVSQAISRKLVGLMAHVIDAVPFYRDRTIVPGYEVGGKTGTAQIWDSEKGRWKDDLFNYSFVGFIGRQADRPDLVVAIRIEEGTPTVRKVGQLEMPVMSFELFRRIATNAIETPDLLRGRPLVERDADR